MKQFCPNKSSKLFKELASIFGEDKAYLLWMRNKGNELDKAPNGALSKLFLNLLDYFKGDRTEALKAKAKVYSNDFINWFGDWLHQNYEEVIISEKETVNRDQNWVDGSEVILENGKYYYANELGTKKEITKKEYDDFNSGKDIVLSEKVHKEKKYNHSKVLDKNGEPLVMYHVTTTKGIRIFDRAKSKHGGFWFSRNPNYYVKDSQNNPHVAAMPCFLNIREPNEIEHNIFLDAVDGDVTQETLDNTRFDGWITRYEHKPEFYGDIYSESAPIFAMATTPNQIKSAVSNKQDIITGESGFSNEDDNIYFNLKSKEPKTPLEIKILLENILRDYYGFKRNKGLSIPFKYGGRFKRERDEVIIKLLQQEFGLPDGTIKFEGKSTIVVIDLEKIKESLESLRNKINHSSITSVLSKINLVKFLSEKIKKLNPKIIFVESSKWSGRMENGLVFLNINASLDIAAEECLHPFVEAIYYENKELFNQLLKESKSEFKSLWLQIKTTYKDFSAADINKELVTLALSRHFADVYLHPELKSIWRRAIDWILEKLGIINVKELPHNLTLRELAEMIYEANNININDVYFEKEQFNLSPLNQQEALPKRVFDIYLQVDADRTAYVERSVNEYRQANTKMDPQQLNTNITRIRLASRKHFDEFKLKDTVKQILASIARAFGLFYYEQLGYWKTGQNASDKETTYYEYVINSLSEDTFGNWRNNNNFRFSIASPNANYTLNIIHKAIVDGDILTLDKELAKSYIRVFWETPLIQTGLELMLKRYQCMPDELEGHLVEAITTENPEQRYHNQSILDYIRSFWNDLKNLVLKFFNIRDISLLTDAEKQSIIDGITSAYTVTEDLETVNGILTIYDRIDGNYSSSQHLTEKDRKIMQRLRSGTDIRLKSVLSRKIKDQRLINEIRSRLELLNNANDDNIDDVFNTIENFLTNAENDIFNTLMYLDNILNEPDMSKWDAQLINYIRYDLIGFYNGLLNDILNLFYVNPGQHRKTAIELLNEERIAAGNVDLYDHAKQLSNDLTHLENYYYASVVKPYVLKFLTDFVNSEEGDFIEDREAFLRTMTAYFEQDRKYGDLAIGELALGMASRSRSPIVRIIERLATKSEMAKGRKVLKRGNEIMRMYNKIRPFGSLMSLSNFQKMFIELDSEDGRSGLPTGYFIRAINYGRFFREKDEFEDQLRIKYMSEGVKTETDPVTRRVKTIFPEEDTKADDSVYNRYMDELDKWLDEHCERRYTLEYYKNRRRILSRLTIEAQSAILREIDLLRKMAINEDGVEDLYSLTREDRAKLNRMLMQKQELSSYYTFTQIDGVLHLKEKEGEQALIAEEIRNWNKHIEGKINYKLNKLKYQDDLNKIIAKYGANSNQVTMFKHYNKKIKISLDFFDMLDGISLTVPQTLEYEELKARHRQIMKQLYVGNGYFNYDLSKAGYGINQDTSLWQELARIEQRMSDIKIVLDNQSNDDKPFNDKPFNDKPFRFNPIMNTQTAHAFLYDLRLKWLPEFSSNFLRHADFENLFTYIDRKGRRRTLNAFKYFSPVAYEMTVPGTNRIIKTIEEVYGSAYSELDESSEYVNEKYDNNNLETLLPKHRKDPKKPREKIDYTNEKFLDIQKNSGYMLFYDLLIKTMDEANKEIPERALTRSYLLPQITSRGLTTLARTATSAELFRAIGYGFLNTLGYEFLEQGKDASTNMDLPRRPDGTIVNNIPIRFVRRLPQPWLVSTDVIGSVMSYYDMAMNYSEKSKILPSVELIQDAIKPQRGVGLEQQFKKVQNLLDFRFYGKEDNVIFEDKVANKINKMQIKLGKDLRRLSSLSMLALNFTTMEVGYLDAFLSAIADACGKKFFTKSDLLYGYGWVWKHFPKMAYGLGQPVVDDWLVAAMQYNQLSKSNMDIFDKTDASRLHRLLTQFQMGGYTLGDYLINTMILSATYHHYRYVTDLNTGKKRFMSRSEVIRMYTNHGYKLDEAIKIYDKAKTTLKDAYKCVDGYLTLKDEYKDAVTTSLEDRIASRLRDRTAFYNGIIPATEKAKVQQNVWGSYLTLMRNFYVNTYWEKFHVGSDFLTEEEVEGGRIINSVISDRSGYANFEQGENGNAVYASSILAIWKILLNVKNLILHQEFKHFTQDQKYALMRVVVEFGTIITSMAWAILSIVFARKFNYDDDKDPTFTVNLIDPEGTDRSLIDFNGNNWFDKHMNWLRWKIALLATRTFTERTTFYWPGTILELVQNPSTAISYFKNCEEVLSLASDLFGMKGHSADEELTGNSGYKHMSRGTRDILKILSPTGFHNWIRSWRTPGIQATLNWYLNIWPNKFVMPKREDDKKKKNKQKKGSIDF